MSVIEGIIQTRPEEEREKLRNIISYLTERFGFSPDVLGLLHYCALMDEEKKEQSSNN